MKKAAWSKKWKWMTAAMGLTVLLAAGAAVFLNGRGGEAAGRRQDAFTLVALDVNPSIEILLDQEDKVITVLAANDDAGMLVQKMKLEGKRTDEAVKEIAEALIRNGYLNERQRTILISVDCEEDRREAELSRELSGYLTETLKENNLEGIVIRQELEVEEELREKAEESRISVGKMAFIRELVKREPALSMEELSAMPVEQIIALIQEKQIDLSGIAEWDADDSLQENVYDIIEDLGEKDAFGTDGIDKDDTDDTDGPDDADDKDGPDNADDTDDPDDADDTDGPDDADDADDPDDADDMHDADDLDDTDGIDDPDDADDPDDDDVKPVPLPQAPAPETAAGNSSAESAGRQPSTLPSIPDSGQEPVRAVTGEEHDDDHGEAEEPDEEEPEEDEAEEEGEAEED